MVAAVASPTGLGTVGAAASEIRGERRARLSDRALMDQLIQLNKDLSARARISEETLRAAVVDRPVSTGSRRWDAALAGVTEYALTQRGVAAPPWLGAAPRLRRRWSPAGGTPAVRAFLAERTPSPLLRRNVLLHDAVLSSQWR